MKTYYKRSGRGITMIPPNSENWLVSYEISCGTKCGNCCTYCDKPIDRPAGERLESLYLDLLGKDYAIMDPETPLWISRDAARMRHRSRIQMGACVDFWCDAAKMHDLGRRSLEAILSHEDWSVQILTKNAAIEKDFDILKKNSRRVRIGLNITAPASKTAVMSVVEPNASANPERMTTLWKAHKLGLSTYVMVGPLLPRIGDSEACIDELVGTAAECGVDVILAKPLNARGLALRRTQKALAKAGYAQEAAAIESIKTRKGWSRYAAEMACNFQRSCLKLYQTGCLRFFLRQSRLVEDDISRLEMNDHGIEWIGGRRKRYGEVR